MTSGLGLRLLTNRGQRLELGSDGCFLGLTASGCRAADWGWRGCPVGVEQKGMDCPSPILIRLFKEEAELEVWKQDRSGKFALLKTYPICRWSGDLGPKVREGDRQAPEGFYAITPGQMNPQSAYYLSFNTGYPNAYDRALGRTGSQLMGHGDCAPRGGCRTAGEP